MNEKQRTWLRGMAADIVLHVRRGRWHTTEVEQVLADLVTRWPLVAAQASPPTPEAHCQDGVCNPYEARCGAKFCTLEEMTKHNRGC